jgi:hypothetical protein
MIPMPLKWTEFEGDPRACKRLGAILDTWERTPYSENPGPNPKGIGVSCVGFLCGVLDELHRAMDPIDYPSLPRDLGMNNPSEARTTLRHMLEAFPKHDRVNVMSVQPGDILVVGQAGPGHAMIVGPRRNTIWHAGGPSVHYTGWVLPPHSKLFAVYRLRNRDSWI